MNYQLLNALRQLRQTIKEVEKISQGRMPVVCDDEALFQIVSLEPKKLTDFEGIPGVGKAFIENYGEQFLEVIRKYSETPAEKMVPLTESIIKTLKELEKKLVNINRRNRLLYLPKLAKKFSFDLFGIGVPGLEKLLFGTGDSVLICDMQNPNFMKSQVSDAEREGDETSNPERETGFSLDVSAADDSLESDETDPEEGAGNGGTLFSSVRPPAPHADGEDDLPDAENGETEEKTDISEEQSAEAEVSADSEKSRTKTQASAYRALVQLLREVTKDLRDKGQNDLYVGYPFVIGRLSADDFSIRAPLALFPVVADKNSTRVQLTLDYSRDILFNSALLLAHFKFNGISKPLPENTLEDSERDVFITDLLDFYEKQGIQIQSNDEPFRKFAEFSADEFPKFQPGELHLEPCAVLGKFPVCANSIQKDFEEILESNEINPLLNDLLTNIDGIDYFADFEQEDATLFSNGQELHISEKDLHYVNELNSSQERVLAAVQVLDKLVIQGPPGTGKSQTIVSLIAQTVVNGKTVLMVSEKKTALDVVYSRLGELSRYALLIDDVGNKNIFYQQLAQMVGLDPENQDVFLETEPVSEKIESIFAKLENLCQKLTVPGTLGIAAHDLYLQSAARTPDDSRYAENLLSICARKNPLLLTEKFDSLERCRQIFSDSEKVKDFETFRRIRRNAPWMEDLRTNLTPIDIRVLSDTLKKLEEEIRQWRGGDAFFQKIIHFLFGWFTKRKISRKINEILKQYFGTAQKRHAELLEKKLEGVLAEIENYAVFQELKFANSALSPQEELYFESMIQIRDFCEAALTELNTFLFCALLYEHITKFEAENRDVFQNIHDFDFNIELLDGFFADKRQKTRQNVQKILADGMNSLVTSKRRGDILRLLESKRKWSVNKFIKKFDFELFKSVKIWLMTPEVVSELIPLQKGIFDLVIFDEASQMYVERGLPSILRGKKVVVAGDHKQLRPSSLGAGRIENTEDAGANAEELETSAALEEESLLDLARFKYQDVLLNFHYRAKYSELIEFSNYAFYRGKLHVSPNVETPDTPPIEVHRIQGAKWKDRSNLKEAEYVVELLKKFFNERKHEETIGIITFNTNQRDLIEDLIDEECLRDELFASQIRQERVRTKDGEDIGFFVKNIESVQGDERDVIIFSVAYAQNEKGKLAHNFGWLNQTGGENRLNVAISRAKRKIHLVQSFDPSELQVESSKNEGPKIFKKYLEYAAAVSRRDQETMRSILWSFIDPTLKKDDPGVSDELFRNMVKENLAKCGYEIETQVGVGGYRIDLAVKKDGKYLLGIECGSWADSKNIAVRERDYHRQKYLRARGWNIYRIWSPDWWKNPQREIEKVRSFIDSMEKETAEPSGTPEKMDIPK